MLINGYSVGDTVFIPAWYEQSVYSKLSFWRKLWLCIKRKSWDRSQFDPVGYFEITSVASSNSYEIE